jgi:hypothetical protein
LSGLSEQAPSAARMFDGLQVGDAGAINDLADAFQTSTATMALDAARATDSDRSHEPQQAQKSPQTDHAVTRQLDSAGDIKPSMNHYTYRAEWSSEQREYLGRCIELPWLSQWAPTLREAIADIGQAVDECIAERNACGDALPTPLTERQYSGRFLVRTSPALHARLAIEAAEQNVSLNQWAVQKLAGRQPSSLFDM